MKSTDLGVILRLNKVIICLIESNENTIVTFSYDRGLKGMIQGTDLTQELCFV